MPGKSLPIPLCRPCCNLVLRPGFLEYQQLAPYPSPPRVRDARVRFARERFGNPRGRPAASPIPSGMPDLVARPLRAQALSDLLDRKLHLLRALAAQLLPPPLASTTLPQRLGIDLSSPRTVEDFGSCCLPFWRASHAAKLRRRGGVDCPPGAPGCVRSGASRNFSAGWPVQGRRVTPAGSRG
jgi:hypothetical protein